ncbi:mechanosensitive ion channel domain-containing protein [Glaciecola sp. 2405UD65-10]|uniref:mechanosensitive ion channel domain-containing protein n=1 Tax=Glaciecola sp. 2405UD65-10 TaxID=3397244 RepID=UPI003B5C4F78
MENFHPQDWLILLITLTLSGAVLSGLNWLLLTKHKELSAEQRLPRQLTMLAFTIVAIVAVVLSLPVQESSRNQLLALLGVLISGVIAFSSTTIVSNLMAGIVLSLNRPFRTGDYIKCNGFAGRVIEKGLLDTEIQTEQRTLIHVANSQLITAPVEVVRSSGTFISAEISIGYDTHHSLLSKHLEKAAQNAGLSDAFVHVTALGDFSVSYKVVGMLLDTKSMLTTRSKLHVAILDELHNNDIEILSPKFVASRTTDPDKQFIAKAKAKQIKETLTQEDIAFDKAEEAEKIDSQKSALQERLAELKQSLSDASEEQKEAMKLEITSVQESLKQIETTPTQAD